MEKITGAKIKVGLKMPADLHRTVKSEAARRGLSVERAYEQALEGWAEGAVQQVANPEATSPANVLGVPIPTHLVPVLAWVVDWFATPSSPEVQGLQSQMMQWSQKRWEDLYGKKDQQADQRNQAAS